MKDIGFVLLLLLIGVLGGVMLFGMICTGLHTKPMDALGIERFQRCEINTTNCHSNWYEIVWKKEHHK